MAAPMAARPGGGAVLTLTDNNLCPASTRCWPLRHRRQKMAGKLAQAPLAKLAPGAPRAVQCFPIIVALA